MFTPFSPDQGKPHYRLGEFTIILRPYREALRRCLQARTYPLKEGTVINTLIKPVIDNKMYHFGFLPYGNHQEWKGCGDFMYVASPSCRRVALVDADRFHSYQWWGVLCRCGIITSADSKEDPDSLLGSDLTRTYACVAGGVSNGEVGIGKGWYFSWGPVDDEYTPDHFYYNILAGPDY